MRKEIALVGLAALFVAVAGCSSKSGNIALGAGAAGAAYEYQNKRAMDELERDHREGKISQQEYERRKQEIEKRSIIQ